MFAQVLEMIKEITANAGSAVVTADQAVKVVKNVRELIKGAGSAVPAEVREKLNELQESLAEAREANVDLRFALMKATEALKAQDTFDKEKPNFSLVELYPEAFAYWERKPADPTAPRPYLCVHCFDNGQKSILQQKEANMVFTTLVCPACKNAVLKKSTITADMGRIAKRDTSWVV